MRLAKGGMAEVFLARQAGPAGFEKTVAVKRILPHLSRSPEFVQMFLDEARIAALLDHAHITHVYDVGTGRELAETDTLGGQTKYGYDEGGFLRTVTDPNGNVTTTEHDVRGNTVSSTTCQNRLLSG